MSFNSNDSRFMARAIQLARQGWFTTRTNPRVGCVLVKNTSTNKSSTLPAEGSLSAEGSSQAEGSLSASANGSLLANGFQQIIGQGWHEKPGLPHAEVNAIFDAEQNGFDTVGATAYVTLEPCSHFGKTPPCVQALITAGVSRVVCAMTDPNPQVSGRGIDMLRDAGIEVTSGLMQEEAEQLNSGFIKRMKQNLPRVVAKIAVSVDGRTAMASGESQWITGPDARAEVQRLRAQSGAIITGSGTVLHDDPSMNVRAEECIRNEHFVQPLRIVIDSRQQVSPDAKIFQNEGRCWLVSTDKPAKAFASNVDLVQIGAEEGRVKLESLLAQLAAQGINDVLVEAGNELLGAFLQQGLVDELQVFMAPKLLGSAARPTAYLPFDSMSQAINLELQDVRQIGQDLKLIYRVE